MTPIFIKALPDMSCINVMLTSCCIACQTNCIRSGQVGVSGYKPKWNHDVYIHQCTSRYGLHWGNVDFICNIVPQNDLTQSEQVCVSGNKPHWNNQTTPTYLSINTLPDMICIDVMSILCGTAPRNDWTHSEQVWVSGYKPLWNNQMMAT